MAVYKRTYRAYDGVLTPRRSRFLILTRYSARAIQSSKALTIFFVLCLIWPALCIAGLYLNHNTAVLSAMKFNSDHLFDVGGTFFLSFMGVQAALAFIATAFIGPNLVAPDLANNALPLYFCRPLTRVEYIVGRGSVIVIFLSLITWVPGLLLFGIETTLSGLRWAWDNRILAEGVLLGSAAWIAYLTLLALALSAWVRWKLVAGGLLLGVMFVSTGFAAAFNAVLRTKAGFYFDPAALVATIWANLLKAESPTDISTFGACIALGVNCAVLIWILLKKVRAYEVIR